MSGGTIAARSITALRISVAVRRERYAAAVGTTMPRVTAFAQLLTSNSKVRYWPGERPFANRRFATLSGRQRFPKAALDFITLADSGPPKYAFESVGINVPANQGCTACKADCTLPS